MECSRVLCTILFVLGSTLTILVSPVTLIDVYSNEQSLRSESSHTWRIILSSFYMFNMFKGAAWLCFITGFLSCYSCCGFVNVAKKKKAEMRNLLLLVCSVSVASTLIYTLITLLANNPSNSKSSLVDILNNKGSDSYMYITLEGQCNDFDSCWPKVENNLFRLRGYVNIPYFITIAVNGLASIFLVAAYLVCQFFVTESRQINGEVYYEQKPFTYGTKDMKIEQSTV
eukprot:NODE_4634_length_1137_cov_59.020710_g4114_i0.p1 GENE.NODE_4634_length_1137_cov_59.020710_g4114_i0~~NODE_4634_length_1137_cov_59.020710_g4114_i0.p1  ORF type:complete len:228 (+),score=14.62 NODE_4634_length_1137_cov_59.020710_g4114_i0:19-702(+)